ncbi:MAG TPA: hypothetical protein VLY04_13905 [Bryobacteraceae bacterium]|nr:hypothetical protein [Bryobacteraceae bacterium]
MTNLDDEKAIRGLLQAFADGWNQADGATVARPFAQDADFTAINGLRARNQAGEPPLPGVTYTSAGAVVVKEHGEWSIAVFRNMVPFERPTAGPLDRELLVASRR